MGTFKMWLICFLTCVSTVYGRGPFSKQFIHKDINVQSNGQDVGEPLFLTPYIDKGDIDTARMLSTVGALPNDTGFLTESFSGFFTVNETYDSNMFFWFFPTMESYKEAPVVLWLQGGPGGSSLFGLFVENGPIGAFKNLTVFERDISWAKRYSMLYIDNPVGTGFSFTKNDAGYATTEEEVGENLYKALVQFFQLFPELKNNDFYITGESYAGKYIPALAHRIHKEPHPKKVLLRGVAIGDGFTDPATMIAAYPDLLFNIGVMDENQRDYMMGQIHIIKYLIEKQQYQKAQQVMDAVNQKMSSDIGGLNLYNYLQMRMWDRLLNGDETSSPTFYQNATGCTNYYNFAQCVEPVDTQYYGSLLELPSVRKAIHVGNLTYNSGAKVEEKLNNDILKTVAPWLAEIMNYYKVCLYSGQLDIIVGAPLTELMLQNLQWSYSDEYKAADKLIWKVNPNDTEVAGYVRRVHDFYQIIVRGAGHILPYDQPERAFDMIDRFIMGTPFA